MQAPQKITLKRLPELGNSVNHAYTTEPEAAKKAAEINQPFYYYWQATETYFVPDAPGRPQ